MTGRKNAMLTTEDRRWLTGEKHYEGEHAKQQRYQRRRDIRDRVYNSLLDFSILFEHLDADEREKLFGSPETGQQPVTDDRELADGIRDGLAFLLYSTGITAAMRTDESGTDPIAEWLLVEALHRAGEKDGLLVEDVDIDIDAIELPRSSLLEDLREGEDLSPRELRVLLESEDVDTAAVQEQLREQLFEDR
jgi:translation elongation factor EF-1beta